MKDALDGYVATVEKTLKTGGSTEHSHRPAVVAMLERIGSPLKTINEAKHIECGAPDVTILTKSNLVIGYVETKDVGSSLADAQSSLQMQRYRKSLQNLVLTDYLEFRWYVDGELRLTARLGTIVGSSTIKATAAGKKEVAALLQEFLGHSPAPIKRPADLAMRMAKLAHIVRDVVVEAFGKGHVSKDLRDLRRAFAEVLIPDLAEETKTPDFADMYAQTIVYGFFAARINHHEATPFIRYGAARDIPKTNPLLRRVFETITGSVLDEEPYVEFVEDLVTVLANCDIDAILEDFGNRKKHQDPVIHFYETFLAEYDPTLRERRGVFFTPEPVVTYIVKSVDKLLKSTFAIPDGLADSTKTTYKKKVLAVDPGSETAAMKPTEIDTTAHRVLVLDPACGTGTFLYTVIDFIRDQYAASGNAGLWPSYVREHLLPRMFGFEILMAPYAVAHFALSLQLAAMDMPKSHRKDWAYDLADTERLRVYLTNTLEPAKSAWSEFFGALRILTEEANAASNVKADLPIMVIIGNPPYSGQSANRSWEVVNGKRTKTFIGRLLDDYYKVDGAKLEEKNPRWLQDDYVKFIRWGQWRIERSGHGVLAMITNHGYLDNPTFRGMRQQLMNSFDDIFVLDLHGNTKKKERAPDGSPDKNVFEIQQGVSIGIFVKRRERAGKRRILHADLWGLQAEKYDYLLTNDVETTKWAELTPTRPDYLFRPQDSERSNEYRLGWPIPEIFPIHSVGIATARDHLTVHNTKEEAWATVQDFVALDEPTARSKYELGADAEDWKVTMAQADLKESGPIEDLVAPLHYRPFDIRYTYYTGHSRGFLCRPRPDVMRHMLSGPNVGIITSRLTKGEQFRHVDASATISEVICLSPKTSNNGFLFPLYLYPQPDSGRHKQHVFEESLPWKSGKKGRRPNLNPTLISLLETALGLRFVSDGPGDLAETFGPEDVQNYVFGVLHSPAFRRRYAEALTRDFPHIQFPRALAVFKRVSEVGKVLLSLHLLEESALPKASSRFPVAGENLVSNGFPRYLAPGEKIPESGKMTKEGRVYINEKQFIEGVSANSWAFEAGGYRVCEKWLKERRGSKLSYEDLKRYQSIVSAIGKINDLSASLDGIVGQWPLASPVERPAAQAAPAEEE